MKKASNNSASVKKLRNIFIVVFITYSLGLNAQYTWEEAALPDSIGVVDIAFNTDNEIFIATDHGPYSSKNGVQWEWLGIDDYPGTIYINSNNTIYIGSGTLYRSINNGITWDTLVYYSQGGINSIYSTDDVNIFFGTWGGYSALLMEAQTGRKYWILAIPK